MSKIIQRLIVFFVGMPALFSVLVLFPQKNHLFFNILTVIFSVLGALEFRNILAQKSAVISRIEAGILGALSPAVWTAAVSFGADGRIAQWGVILGASWLLVSWIFVNGKNFDSCSGRITSGFAVMVYPGLFLSWIVQMSLFSGASMVILVYFALVFLNDSLAWLAGVLFGKNNRGFVSASPGKSIAGFAGGLAASVAAGIAAAAFLPEIFTSALLPSLPAGALLGLGTGTAAILGDLGESAIKRGAGLKDSGSLIMGRGGVLDSIDSLVLAAPVFSVLYRALF